MTAKENKGKFKKGNKGGNVAGSKRGKYNVPEGFTITHALTYSVWCAMKTRCYNSSSTSFNLYGGRGIVVCDEWKNDFSTFLKDMGERPSKNHSIDRIDPNGNYTPANCRWATYKQQANNKRNTVYVFYKGEVKAAGEVANLIHKTSNKVRMRSNSRYSIDDIDMLGFKEKIAIPLGQIKTLLEAGNTIRSIAKLFNVDDDTIKNRLDKHMDLMDIYYKSKLIVVETPMHSDSNTAEKYLLMGLELGALLTAKALNKAKI